MLFICLNLCIYFIYLSNFLILLDFWEICFFFNFCSIRFLILIIVFIIENFFYFLFLLLLLLFVSMAILSFILFSCLFLSHFICYIHHLFLLCHCKLLCLSLLLLLQKRLLKDRHLCWRLWDRSSPSLTINNLSHCFSCFFLFFET